ncbi:MAG: phosphoribosyltransferase family protein [Cyclobacteriaceae bacterium]
MKYKNMPQIGRFLGSEYGRKLHRAGVTADIIIPVPIHAKKEALRGFNQSQIIAEGLSERLEIPIDSKSVIRKSFTTTQTRKSRVERWLNVEQIYQVKEPQNFEGKTVMVVDDVLTTGATIGTLVDELVNVGVKSISIVTIAAGK